MRAVALIDGEHYPDVVRDALRELPYEWVGAILVGGNEKLREEPDYGVPLCSDFGGAEIVVDLSDEPVLGPAERFRWASRALAAGLPYVGADFRFDPPTYEELATRSVAVIGAGKRVGKTAVAAHLAALLAREQDVVVVAMGRGGPAEPEVVERPPTVADLVALSRAGRHAASDHLEIAALCGRADDRLPPRRRRAGREGVRLERARGGAARRRARAGRRRLRLERHGHPAGRGRPARARRRPAARPRLLLQHLPAARLGPRDRDRLRARGRRRRDAAPAAARQLEGRVAVFTAGGTEITHLDADVVHLSPHLADRAALRAELADLEADTYLVEVKAAAIDVVAEDALARGRRVVLAANDVVGAGLDEALLELLPAEVHA